MDLGDRVLRAYYVWPDFPSISLSGEHCGLNCRHCAAIYLKDMQPAESPEHLLTLGRKLKERGAKGLLLSGGCDVNGRLLNLPGMLPAIRELHDMGLIIKLHTGLVDEGLAAGIAKAGVDIASMEMVGDTGTIRRIFGIPATVDDYAGTFRRLVDAGVPQVCPHICVGLDGGELKGEFRALELLSEFHISTLAIIVLWPTKGTDFEDLTPPSGEDVGRVVSRARELFPDTKLILGSLRPRGNIKERLDIEIGALDGGIDGVEVPSREMLAEAGKRGMRIKRIEAYGVLPMEYEGRVITRML